MRTLSLALLTAVVGGILGAVLGDVATEALGVTDFEGARGYAVVFLCIPLGLAIGAIVGVTVGRWLGPTAPWWKAQGWSLLVTALIGFGLTGVIVLSAPTPPTLGGAELDLALEIRMPPGRAVPDSADHGVFSAVLVSNDKVKDRVGVQLDFSAASLHEGRVVIPGTVWLAESTRRRSLAISDSTRGVWFDLPLRARPDSSDMAWSAWFPAPGERASSDVGGTGGFQVRWRVVAAR